MEVKYFSIICKESWLMDKNFWQIFCDSNARGKDRRWSIIISGLFLSVSTESQDWKPLIDCLHFQTILKYELFINIALQTAIINFHHPQKVGSGTKNFNLQLC